MKGKHNIFHYIFTAIYKFIQGIISSFIWIFVTLAGYLIFQTKKTPYDIVLGIPLILIGGGLIINKLGDSILAVSSPRYNKAVCIFCSK